MKINLIDYLDETVQKNLSKTAVIDGDHSINFQQLSQRVKLLAWHLSDFVNESLSKPIAVYLPKSIDCIIADIAVTQSGNVYMNLDVKSPALRIKNIIDLVQPLIVITNNEYATVFRELGYETLIFNIDEINSSKARDLVNVQKNNVNVIDTDPYCIINTSGSTGTPKGVVLNHRSFIDFIEVSSHIFNFSGQEIIGSLSPSVFDIYSFELCMLMTKGVTISLIPDHLAAYPVKILDLLHKTKVCFIFWVPTIMVNIANLNLLEDNDLQCLKRIWFAGEVFPTMQFNYWKKHLPQCEFANLYGPIEITLDCTYFKVNREFKDDEPLPIGIPYRNTDVFILNEYDELIRDSEEGELCVRGSSLAMGYYNDPLKTAEVFVQNPLNNSYPELIYRTGDIVCRNQHGEILFKGRKDTLIKHLGYRIELGEIEHILVNSIKITQKACVVYNQVKKEITVFYESIDEIPAKFFRDQLLTMLPKYMVPTKFIRFGELPTNTNGKIDRLGLKKSLNG